MGEFNDGGGRVGRVPLQLCWKGQERLTVDRVGGSKWNGNPLASPEERESQFEKERDGAHPVPRDRSLTPRVGARWRKQTVSGEDGCCPQHERNEQVDVDVVASAAQPPGGFGRQSEDLALATQSPLNYPPSPSHRTTFKCLLPVEPDYPILLGKLKPSLCFLHSGLGVPPEETQDEQGEQQCGKG